MSSLNSTSVIGTVTMTIKSVSKQIRFSKTGSPTFAGHGFGTWRLANIFGANIFWRVLINMFSEEVSLRKSHNSSWLRYLCQSLKPEGGEGGSTKNLCQSTGNSTFWKNWLGFFVFLLHIVRISIVSRASKGKSWVTNTEINMKNDETSWKNVKKSNSRALAKTFFKKAWGGRGGRVWQRYLSQLELCDFPKSAAKTSVLYKQFILHKNRRISI